MAYQVPFLEAVKTRRSTTDITKESPISDARIENLIKHAIKYGPTAFNVQSSRTLILFGAHHDKLWDILYDISKKSIPPQVFEQVFAPKIQGYKAGYGTVSFIVLSFTEGCSFLYFGWI